MFKETVVDGIIERIKSDNQSPDKYDKMDEMRMNEKRWIGFGIQINIFLLFIRKEMHLAVEQE